jgi:hypothetical protein
MASLVQYYVNRATPVWAGIPMLLSARDSTATPGALAENQILLLNAIARPIVVADETGRPLYQPHPLRECLDHASVQERIQLQRALQQAVTDLCARFATRAAQKLGGRHRA